MSRADVQFLLNKYGLRADKRKSQHFLVDDSVLDRITDAFHIRAHEPVLEIGPGIGNLTTRLTDRAGRVVAIELDTQFEKLLTALKSVHPNLDIYYEDVFRVPFDRVAALAGIQEDQSYSIVGNIPYHITSKLIAYAIALPVLPRMIGFLIQKEVAERIVAKDGNHTKLSLSVQVYGTPSIEFVVPRTAFYPEPEVDSALLCITNIHRWPHAVSEKRFWQIVRIGFSSKRKKLANNLMAGLRKERGAVESVLNQASVSPSARAEDLSINDWLRVVKELESIA